MSNHHNQSINEFDFNLICEYFSSIERQGPGSPEATVRALSFIDNLTSDSHIADVGCGTGSPTRVLAQHTPCRITGIDLFPHFIELFNDNAESQHLQDRVKGVVASMCEMPFREEELDLIWSEGAIYNIGYLKGLTEWHRYLKQGGYIAVSEATWFTDERPAEINDYWMDAYPEIDTVANKILQMQKAGYSFVSAFVLPENCWTDHYYALQVPAHETFLLKHKDNRTACDLVAAQRHEAQMYAKYKEYYGYVFYIGKKS